MIHFNIISNVYTHSITNLDIFPENTEKPTGFRCFQGIKKGNNDGLIKFTIPRSERA